MAKDIIKLGDVATYINGYAFKPEDRGEEGLQIIRIQDLTGNSYDLGFYNGKYPKKIEINDGDVLISWSASLGVYVWNGGKALLNQHIFKVNPKSYFSKEYVYEQLSSYIVNFVKMAEARKTTMGHITTDHLEQSKIPLPPESLIKQFKEKIYPIHLKIGQTKQENRELTKLRDWLLPMLMNGQARVE